MHCDSSSMRADDLFTLRLLMILNLASASEASCSYHPSGFIFLAAVMQGEGQSGKRTGGGCHFALSLLPHRKTGYVKGRSRMTLLFLTLADSAPGCGLLPVGATNSLAALKLYFYRNYTYRFLFQFSIYSFCLVQFHAVFVLFFRVLWLFFFHFIVFFKRLFVWFFFVSQQHFQSNRGFFAQNWEMLQLLWFILKCFPVSGLNLLQYSLKRVSTDPSDWWLYLAELDWVDVQTVFRSCPHW